MKSLSVEYIYVFFLSTYRAPHSSRAVPKRQHVYIPIWDHAGNLGVWRLARSMEVTSQVFLVPFFRVCAHASKLSIVGGIFGDQWPILEEHVVQYPDFGIE